MSRQVDTSDMTLLSEDDLDYVATRGMVHLEKAVAAERKRRARAEKEGIVTEEVDEPYSKWKVEDLRDECKARNLSTEGKKDELVERLEADDAKS